VRTRLLAPLALTALIVAGCGGGSSDHPASATGEGLRTAKKSASADGKPKEYDQAGTVVADSGFRPEKDGFSFENYAQGPENLTPSEVQDMYGPQVCAARQGGQCVLTPPAQAWMNATNNDLSQGGHCFGFSVTALMLFDHALSPLDYGGPSTPQITLQGNTAIQHRIAESFMLQTSPKVQAAELTGTPNQILDALIAGLRNHPDSYTLGFYQRDGTNGHALTPYAVQDKGGGQFALLMYDNNFPGLTRAMEFDRNRNTWRYEASPRPDIKSFLYEGDATTKTQALIPTKPGLGIQPCPFCAGGISAGRASVPTPTGKTRSVPLVQYDRISLGADTVNHAHLLLTDKRGRRTGYVGKRLVKEIPGVRVQPLLTNQNWKLEAEPTYFVPHGLKYSISIDGTTLEAPDTESVSVIGPGFAASVSDILARPGQKQALRVGAGGTAVSYETSAKQPQSPDIQLGFERPGADKTFAVATHKLEPGATVRTAVKPSTDKLAVSGAESRGTKTVVGVTSIKRSGARTTRQQAVPARTRCNFKKGGRACRHAG
jgi:hypothetical protein